MKLAIATRNRRPAHEQAPPRLRQSHISKPFMAPVDEPKGLFSWLRGK